MGTICQLLHQVTRTASSVFSDKANAIYLKNWVVMLRKDILESNGLCFTLHESKKATGCISKPKNMLVLALMIKIKSTQAIICPSYYS